MQMETFVPRRLLTAIAGASVCLLIGCTRSTEVVPVSLVGRWASRAEPLGPAGSLRYTLLLDADGKFTDDVRTFGAYPGQDPGDVSSYSTITGTYVVNGDALVFTPEQMVSWDHFYGSPPVVTTWTWGTLYEGAHFTVTPWTLTLSYTTYPADAPVATSLHFFRH